jgi:uncharacterized membrane protein
MRIRWHKSGWVLVAAIALVAILVVMLAPQVHSAAATGWLPVLLILFIGVVAPLSLISPLAWLHLGMRPIPPVRAISFQRPPPLRRS